MLFKKLASLKNILSRQLYSAVVENKDFYVLPHLNGSYVGSYINIVTIKDASISYDNLVMVNIIFESFEKNKRNKIITLQKYIRVI